MRQRWNPKTNTWPAGDDDGRRRATVLSRRGSHWSGDGEHPIGKWPIVQNHTATESSDPARVCRNVLKNSWLGPLYVISFHKGEMIIVTIEYYHFSEKMKKLRFGRVITGKRANHITIAFFCLWRSLFENDSPIKLQLGHTTSINFAVLLTSAFDDWFLWEAHKNRFPMDFAYSVAMLVTENRERSFYHHIIFFTVFCSQTSLSPSMTSLSLPLV